MSCKNTTSKLSLTGPNRFFIKLASPQISQLGINFLIGEIVMLYFHQLSIVQGHFTEPSTRQDLNPRPLSYEACTLPLCCNHYPPKSYLVRRDQRTSKCTQEGKNVALAWFSSCWGFYGEEEDEATDDDELNHFSLQDVNYFEPGLSPMKKKLFTSL